MMDDEKDDLLDSDTDDSTEDEDDLTSKGLDDTEEDDGDGEESDLM